MPLNVRDHPQNSDTLTLHRGVLDLYNRPLHDLRISVIDRCNFRCTYCMPEHNRDAYTFLNEEQWLTFDAIERLAKLFALLGVTKIRLTGGEPLLRPNLPDLIAKLHRIQGVSDLALTTNGSLLPEYAAALKATGLNRITISLDTLEETLFRDISGGKGDVHNVLEGIRKAEEAGFEDIKINVVVQKNVNDHHILDMVNYFRGRTPILRFIEYMDVGNCNHWDAAEVVPAVEIVELINKHFPLKPMKSNYFGEVAARYQFRDGSGEVGFITSVSQPFCRSCTRLRLSADGKIYTCLFSGKGIDLKKHLAKNISDEEMLKILASAWTRRSDRYSELRAENLGHSQHSSKVEMFQIGG